MTNKWTEANRAEIRDIFRTFRDHLANHSPAIVADPEFKLAYRGARAAVQSVAGRMADPLDYGGDLIGRIVHALKLSYPGGLPAAIYDLVNEAENFRKTDPIAADPMDHWPDGPGTVEGDCWICAKECQVKWLADPMVNEPTERLPWCYKCYRIRRRRK